MQWITRNKANIGAIKGKIREIVLFDAVLLWLCLLVLTTNSNVVAGNSM